MAQKHSIDYTEYPMTRDGRIQGPSRRYRRLRHPIFPAATWTAKNPLLQRGEIGAESDTYRMKIGDGVTYWNDLPYSGDTIIAWGDIQGDIADQTDLQNALDAKQDVLTAGSNIQIDSDNVISATDTTYTASDGVTLTGTNFTNSGVRAVASGTTNGTISVNTNGTSADVAVTGLGSAAYTSSSDYATAAQGAKADTAVQPGNLATVATTGSYNDLLNKPTIPAAQVNSDWDAVSGVAQILNKPTLATVATSGDYDDLLNKPTIPTVNNATLTIQKNGTTVKTFTANASSNVTANITVPTNNNELTNGAGYQTAADVATAISGKQDALTAVTLDTTQTITGTKTFSKEITGRWRTASCHTTNNYSTQKWFKLGQFKSYNAYNTHLVIFKMWVGTNGDTYRGVAGGRIITRSGGSGTAGVNTECRVEFNNKLPWITLSNFKILYKENQSDSNGTYVLYELWAQTMANYTGYTMSIEDERAGGEEYSLDWTFYNLPTGVASLPNGYTQTDSLLVMNFALDSSVVKLAGTQTITGNKSFTGTTTAVTPSASDNSTKVATTAWCRGHGILVASQMPTANNSYTWYRKYADGWVEQGQYTTTTSGQITQFNYPVAMSDSNYTLQITPAYFNSGSSATVNVVTKTKTGFSAWGSQTGQGGYWAVPCGWQVSGMAAN